MSRVRNECFHEIITMNSNPYVDKKLVLENEIVFFGKTANKVSRPTLDINNFDIEIS